LTSEVDEGQPTGRPLKIERHRGRGAEKEKKELARNDSKVLSLPPEKKPRSGVERKTRTRKKRPSAVLRKLQAQGIKKPQTSEPKGKKKR